MIRRCRCAVKRRQGSKRLRRKSVCRRAIGVARQLVEHWLLQWPQSGVSAAKQAAPRLATEKAYALGQTPSIASREPQVIHFLAPIERTDAAVVERHIIGGCGWGIRQCVYTSLSSHGRQWAWAATGAKSESETCRRPVAVW